MNAIITITAEQIPAFDKLIGTWEVYNKSEGMVHLCRIKNGKRLAPSVKNLLNITPAQFAEIQAA